MSPLPVIVNRKIAIALVGCGRISKNHFQTINSFNQDLELVAVCDSQFEVAEENGQAYSVPYFTNLNEMLSNVPTIDVVVLCTPSGLHAEQTIMAAKHGKNVLTEKPMATNWADGLDMVKACDASNVRLFVVKQNRFNETTQLLKRAIKEARFGKIHAVNMNVFWTRPQSYYDQGGGWRGTWEFDGGAFMNQASHYVDLLQWLFGPVDCVQAMTSTYRNIEAEDTGVVSLKWKSGTLGSMAVSMLTFPSNLEGSVTVIGEKGTVKIGGVALNDIQTWDFDDTQRYDDDLEQSSYQTTSVYGFGHPKYYQNVIEVFRDKETPLTDGREGLKSLELLTAIYRSARDKQIVYLPIDRRI